MIRNFICISMLMVPYVFSTHVSSWVLYIAQPFVLFLSFFNDVTFCLIQTYAIASFFFPEFSTPADAKQLELYQRQFAVRTSLSIGSFRMPSRYTRNYAKALECLKQRILRKIRHHFDALFFFS
jgi:hypothetical protein